MQFILLFFDFRGRIGRLQYFLLSLFLGTLAILAMLPTLWPYIAERSVAEIVPELYRLDLTYIGGVFLTAYWCQMALVWKRSRDMTGGTVFAWIYAVLAIIGFVPFLGLLVTIPLLVMQMVLLFKSSDTSQPHNGSAPSAKTVSTDYLDQPAIGIGALNSMSTEDMVKRARELREAAEQAHLAAKNSDQRPRPNQPAPLFGKASQARPRTA